MEGVHRIAILGSGPAGLSAAAHAAARGLSHILIEKSDHLSDTIFRYQRGKHIMATPSQLVVRAEVSFEPGKRETILDTWSSEAAKHKVNVRFHAEVKSITGAKGNFSIALSDGSAVRAETIVLAIGTQGNPNLLGCPGAFWAQALGLIGPGAHASPEDGSSDLGVAPSGSWMATGGSVAAPAMPKPLCGVDGPQSGRPSPPLQARLTPCSPHIFRAAPPWLAAPLLLGSACWAWSYIPAAARPAWTRGPRSWR